jgi:hypothetical protein
MIMGIQVRSNVARDVLQNAAYFNTVPKVVWEYVSNAIDNPRAGHPVTVIVHISRDGITIEDDASGMSREDLARFFEMHGENQARRLGRVVRGRFGTGKSAALGIANTLVVETVKDRRRNVVELHRDQVLAAVDGKPFPVSEVVADEDTDREPGTKVLIRGLNVQQLEVERTKKYVQQHLRHQHQAHQVIINAHRCEVEELPYIDEKVFQPPEALKALIGDVGLTIRVSPQPLDSDDNGVHIFSRGVWHETTLGDEAGKAYTESLFGEVDIPALEDDQGPIPAFDNTRSNQLNRSNRLVVSVLAWVSRSIEQVRRGLADEDRKRRESAQAKELEEQATKIADLLNEDFKDWARELARLQAATRAVDAGTSVEASIAAQDAVTALPGGPLQAPEKLDETGIRLPPGGGKPASPLKGKAPRGQDLPKTRGATGTPGADDGGGPAQREKSRSGFMIAFRNMTAAAFRSRYIQSSRTIVINLDHPLVTAALDAEGGVRGRSFQQLSYEIALTEYAFALGFEIAQREGESYTWDLALNDALNSVNRVSLLLARVIRA